MRFSLGSIRAPLLLFTTIVTFTTTSAHAGCIGDLTGRLRDGMRSVRLRLVDEGTRQELRKVWRYQSLLTAAKVDPSTEDVVGALNEAAFSPLDWTKVLVKAAPLKYPISARVNGLAGELEGGGREIIWAETQSVIRTDRTIRISLAKAMAAVDPVGYVLDAVARELPRDLYQKQPSRATTTAEFVADYTKFLADQEIRSALKSHDFRNELRSLGIVFHDEDLDAKSVEIADWATSNADSEIVYREVEKDFRDQWPALGTEFRRRYQMYDVDQIEQAFKLEHLDQQRAALREMIHESSVFANVSGAARSNYVSMLKQSANLTSEQLRLLKRAAQVP